MKRLVVTVAAALIALTAPAQVWCQATCAVPGQDHETSAVAPHCPSHGQPSGHSVGNAGEDRCRAPESSRSGSPTRSFTLGLNIAVPAQIWTPAQTPALATLSTPPDVPVKTTTFHHSTPLRI